MGQQHDAGNLGMWVFMVTEIMFFGGLFCGYAIYRGLYLSAFEAGSRLLEIKYGATNTAVLIASSLTMALSRSFRPNRSPQSAHHLSDSHHAARLDFHLHQGA